MILAERDRSGLYDRLIKIINEIKHLFENSTFEATLKSSKKIAR